MIRNEYRRSFIMLRAIMPGYGGHVRLEKRTLTGSMYFIITAPQGAGELAAALAGCRNGEYYAAPIGALKRDRRGQLALAWQFDPRNIDGQPLEAYPWLAIVATGGPCALALIGNVDGSRNVDALALERVACTLFAPGESSAAPAADLPEPEFASAPSRGLNGVAPDAQAPSAPGKSSAATAADLSEPEFASAPTHGMDGVAPDAQAPSAPGKSSAATAADLSEPEFASMPSRGSDGVAPDAQAPSAPGKSSAATAADLSEPEFASAPTHGMDGVAPDAQAPSAPGKSSAATAADPPEPEFASMPSRGMDGVAPDAQAPSAPGKSSAATAADLSEREFASMPSRGMDGVAPDAQAPSGISLDGTVPLQKSYDGAADGGDESHGDVRIYTMTRARLRRLAGRGDRAGAHQGTPALDAHEAAASQASPKAERAPVGSVSVTAGTEPEPAALSVDPITAAKQLGLDITAPWPGVAEALRRLFATQAPAADAPDDGFTYVAWPMPDGSGYRESLVGLKADGGKITAIRHALPARRAPEPPAGMEACQWMPTDGENGFWVTEDRGNEINN